MKPYIPYVFCLANGIALCASASHFQSTWTRAIMLLVGLVSMILGSVQIGKWMNKVERGAS